MRIGIKAPEFILPGVDGVEFSLNSHLAGKTAVAVIFTCNHCPYSIAYEERIAKLHATYAAKGVGIVAVNPDNEEKHPDDSLDNMKKRAAERKFTFPYLRDKAATAATAYGAKVLPEVFLVDGAGTIRYTGRIDDCWQSAKRVKRHDLKEAIEDILHERDVAVKITPAIGCAIKLPAL
ncbi:MAG: thioredoxin family protein [Nitrospinae bacterium]|nr:thioredoxin family protein [Nitrospinota bacterium]